MNAFPIAIPAGCEGFEDGMTLRDYFAVQILNGHLSGPSVEVVPYAEAAEWAYAFADAMIEARGE
jgi:hypothetical protein